jgi:hypothetical protein
MEAVGNLAKDDSTDLLILDVGRSPTEGVVAHAD